MDTNDQLRLTLSDAFVRFAKAEWREKPIEGLKRSEIRVLFCIKSELKNGKDHMKVSEISQRLYVTKPTVTQLIKELIAGGLVERTTDLEDRRAACIKLTEKGEQITEEAASNFRASINGLIEHLGEGDSQKLADLLSKAISYYSCRD